jgi:tRNA (mo5U34)-methyltransferase
MESLAAVVDPDTATRRLAEHPLWYHTIDVAPGVATPGGFDLRHVVDLLPWPDVRGKRCLDVGTFDGFFAFELERRGAAEVIGIDVDDPRRLDWPADVRPGVAGAERNRTDSGPARGVGFRLVAELTGSKAQWRPLSIYDLDPSEIGTFDVVVLGSLLLHLRDPVRALEAIRSVCEGWLLSSEQIDPWQTFLRPREPVVRLHGSGHDCQWWVPNAAGHERMLFSAGFAIEARSRPYVERLNPVHSQQAPMRTSKRDLVARALIGDREPIRALQGLLQYRLTRRLTGDAQPGVLHRAVLARPRL